MNTNVNASVKFFNDSKAFGFFRQASKNEPDIFVHLSVLEQFGFLKSDLIMDKPAIIDFKPTEKGLVATKIHQIGDKKAPPTERKCVVDRKDDLIIVKVTEIATDRHLFEIRKGSIDGEQVGDDLFCLAQARQAIGRELPRLVTESVKTNIIGNGPKKGPSPAAPNGFKNPGAKKEKKAA